MENAIPLCVPYWEERAALEAGARFDKEYGFYITENDYIGNVIGWLPKCYNPNIPKPVLVPDMLPDSTWEQNIRKLSGTETWDRLRKHAYGNAGYRCEICGTKGKMEAHEHWELDNDTTTQRLVGLYALCPLCHKVHHLGIAKRLGIYHEVKQHMKRVNNWTDIELYAAIELAYEIWEQRSMFTWTVDLSAVMDSSYAHVNKNGLGSYEIK